jgi:DNA relaxase NicK
MVRKLSDSYGCQLLKVSLQKSKLFSAQNQPCLVFFPSVFTRHASMHQVEYLIESVLALRALPQSTFTITKL